jgi:pimeloyl-ACP methyl ester carboxylesterase
LTVVAFDQPGFGHSDLPQDFSLEARVRHARAFIDTLGLRGAHLAGSSAGAYIAARLALEDAGVTRLVLVASSTLAPRGSQEAAVKAARHADQLREFTPTREAVRALMLTAVFRAELVTDAVVDERLAMSLGPRADAQRRRRGGSPPVPVTPDLATLTAKTLILWGRNDQGAAVERALLLQQAIPGSELHIFDRCAHWVQWDQADRFNRLVADFLRG